MSNSEPIRLDIWDGVAAVRAHALQVLAPASLAPPVREAEVFRRILEALPIRISSTDTLAGDFGWDCATSGERSAMADKIGQMRSKRAGEAHCESPSRLMRDRFHCFGGYTTAHTCADYERVVVVGIRGLLDEVARHQSAASGEMADHLKGMELALQAVVAWAQRYAALAERMASETGDPHVQERLRRIADNCRSVPLEPARSFEQALQAIWLVHAAIGLSEYSGASLSLGRLDQYLFSLLQNDRQSGVPLADLEACLDDLFEKLNHFGDAACTVNLGGTESSAGGDRDLFNDLSAMIVRVAKRRRSPSPILAARIHEGTNASTFDTLTDPELVSMGQPTFYGEEACRRALLRRGVPQCHVHEWAANSCMGLLMPGREISDMWGGVVNVLLPLELALNRGRPFHHAMPLALETHAPDDFATFDDLYATFCRFVDELVEFATAENLRATSARSRDMPNPFLSALIRNCIERGMDRASDGPLYYTVIVEGFGLVNAADALTAIQQLVFETKRYQLEDLVQAAQADFADAAAVQQALASAPKYGNGDPVADLMAAEVARSFAASVRRRSADGVCFAPSFHTLTAHIPAGKKTAASLDSRSAGEPLAKNIGTSPGRCTTALTGLMRSAATIDQSLFYGGQALDVSVDANSLRDGLQRRKFQALLRTYFGLGGLQVQLNGIDADTLEAAMQAPGEHRDLIVKIAGYSARFVSLGLDLQQDLVKRFRHGM